MLEDLFYNTWSQTIVNGIVSDWLVSVTVSQQGLDQGRILSQLLNLLFLDPLNHVIEHKNIIRMFSFVDDYLIFSILKTYLININKILQIEIKNLNEWLYYNKANWKIIKSGIIIFESNIMQLRYPNHKQSLNINIGNENNPHFIKSDHNKIKYLGTLLASNLDLKITINYIYKNANIGYIWIRKAFYNVCTINAYALQIISNSIILGKIGYSIHLFAYVNKSQLDPLRKLWNKVMRMVTGALYTTSIKALQYLSDMGSIRCWINYKSANFFRQLLYKPTNNPIYDQIDKYWYKQWKDDAIIGGSEVTKQAKTYYRKSPFWTAYKNAKEHKLFHIIPFQDYPELAYHPKVFNQKMYLPDFPTNMKIINYKFHYEQQHSGMCENVLYVWPDGSIKSAPNGTKIGGFGVYIETYTTRFTPIHIASPETEWFMAMGKQFDINYVETTAIYNAILELYKNHKLLLKKHHAIHIITDNENAFHWITQQQTVNEKYNYQLILQIYKKITELKICKLDVILQCCRRGIWNGNNKADALAKCAVDDYIKYNGLQHHNHITRISTNTMKTYIKSQWNIIKAKQTRNIHTNAVISRNMALWNIYNEKQPIKWDKIQYQIEEFALLTYLRSEHVRLNWYFHVRRHYKYYKNQIKQYDNISTKLTCTDVCCIDNNNGLCNDCTLPETVYHFLIECGKYDVLRQLYIFPIYELLQQHIQNVSLKDLLFPPINLKWMHRKMILDNIIQYTKATNRIHYR